jgi:hypothetical protein
MRYRFNNTIKWLIPEITINLRQNGVRAKIGANLIDAVKNETNLREYCLRAQASGVRRREGQKIGKKRNRKISLKTEKARSVTLLFAPFAYVMNSGQ